MFRTVAAAILALAAAPAGAQQAATVPWAYSAYFGTGWYEIGDSRDSFVVRVVPRREWREAGFDDDGRRRLGAHWRFPVTIGLNDFPLNDIAGSVDPGNLANVSVTPGLYLDVPVNERWSLRPYAALGWGSVIDDSESAWTYLAGLKSRYWLVQGERQLALINSFEFVGYNPNNGPSEGFVPLKTAFEFSHPVGSAAEGKAGWQLHWHLAFTTYQRALELQRADGGSDRVRDEWSVGIALGRDGRDLRIWRFSFDRLGIAWRASSGGELRGIGLVFKSLFDE